MTEDIIKKLRLRAWLAITLVTIGLVAVVMLHRLNVSFTSLIQANRPLSVSCLLGSAIGSMALPIVVRLIFYRKASKNKGISSSDFYCMKNLEIISVFAGSLFALLAYYIPVFRYHMYLCILAGIYGIYSILPVDRMYQKDISSFRVKNE